MKDSEESKHIYISNRKIKKSLVILMVFTMGILSFAGYKTNEIRTRAFDVYVGEEIIGAVKTEDEAINVVKEVKQELCKEYKADVIVEKDIKIEKTNAKSEELLSKTQLKNKIKSSSEFMVSGYLLNIDGETAGILKSEKEAEYVLNKVKEPYLKNIDKTAKIKEVNILEEIKIVKKDVTLNDIDKQEEVIEYIKTGAEEIKTHTVEVGESFWTIGQIYNIPVEELEKANPDMDSENVRPGDEVKLIVAASQVTILTHEEVEYIEDIQYEVEVELNNSMYDNEKKVKVEGSNGENKIIASEIKHNGILVEKNIIEEEIIKEPVTEVVIKGTKEVPRTVATGTLMMPTRGRLTSGYGRRWGRMHQGIDIAASTGTPIKAADGGTVAFAGSKGTYGYMVEINHGNGYRTRYAHCSKLHVKAGQKVAKGEHIANVGNTGRSTGAHLHFEVLKNGVNQNPSKYVN